MSLFHSFDENHLRWPFQRWQGGTRGHAHCPGGIQPVPAQSQQGEMKSVLLGYEFTDALTEHRMSQSHKTFR